MMKHPAIKHEAPARDYRQSEAYRRSDRRDPTTGQRVFPLPPMTGVQVTRKAVML